MPYSHDDFAAYVRSHRNRLVTTAFLLCQERGEAVELVRDTLARTHVRWRRIPRDDMDFYVRRFLVNRYLRRRHSLRRGELARLSARQRVVLVLLHREGLGEVETAQLLGCSVGAVRSRAQRGLAVCGGRERLLEVFAEVARRDGEDVPLSEADVVRRARELRRRRIGVGVAGCALLLTPPMVFVAGQVGFGGFGGVSASDRAGARVGGVSPGPIRLVAPGERVEPVPGLKVWLTSDGEHWSTPQAAVPAGSPQNQRAVWARVQLLYDGRYFVAGRYEGLSADPRRVEVSVGGEVLVGTVLTLAGGPGWGVWYLQKPFAAGELKEAIGGDGLAVTVYDAGGRAVARSGGGG
ncbi:sigma factor-like helix-turn-helix DNA-binding protein [Streptomyces sp. NPDC004539]|uniref:sigma factor-like helix-turn-helix DNA-binding protein n=1 Tax=Streptomyces sp. NPDC004539 TaxID=3154280 RepID=UPI0033BC5FC1